MMVKSAVPYDTMSSNSLSTESMFNKCCGCITLRIGCFILGYLNLIVNIFRTLFIVLITAYIGLQAYSSEPLPSELSNDQLTYSQIQSSSIGIDSLDRETLRQAEWIMLIVLAADLIWLGVNIACLVGLHKRRPGPIRVYIGFACFRFILSMASYIYRLHGSYQQVIISTIDLGLSAYFICVYYVYAVKLEEENLRAQEVTPVQPPAYTTDIPYYPTKIDKEHLVV